MQIIHALLDSFYMGQLDKNLLIISLSCWMWTTPTPAPNPVCRITWALNTWLLNGWMNDSSSCPGFFLCITAYSHLILIHQVSLVVYPLLLSDPHSWTHLCTSRLPQHPDQLLVDFHHPVPLIHLQLIKGYHALGIDFPPHLTAVHVVWHSCSSDEAPASDSFCLICLPQV